jgi:pimeloyl-ACP methyl ester carboxylesterase
VGTVPIRYATTQDGIQIAYRVLGDGPIDVVWVNGFSSNLDYNDRSPLFGRFESRLPRIARVLEFDKRGSGLSDHTLGSGALEDRIDDIRAAMDAAGFARATLQASADGGPIALAFAATYPERVTGLVLQGTWARFGAAPGYDVGVPPEISEPARRHRDGRAGCAPRHRRAHVGAPAPGRHDGDPGGTRALPRRTDRRGPLRRSALALGRRRGGRRR